ncbi:MAG: hypothetical protein KY468_06465 [Armatimonadetes bacterium]|nr:hypothetical protein [Armatimonadota bacterium]
MTPSGVSPAATIRPSVSNRPLHPEDQAAIDLALELCSGRICGHCFYVAPETIPPVPKPLIGNRNQVDFAERCRRRFIAEFDAVSHALEPSLMRCIWIVLYDTRCAEGSRANWWILRHDRSPQHLFDPLSLPSLVKEEDCEPTDKR